MSLFSSKMMRENMNREREHDKYLKKRKKQGIQTVGGGRGPGAKSYGRKVRDAKAVNQDKGKLVKLSWKFKRYLRKTTG